MSPIWHTIIIGTLSYIALIIVLRVSGKRTLSKWNAFDFIVTIALGSTLATSLMSNSVTLGQSVTAFIVIVLLQFVITFFSVRSVGMRKLIKAEPTLLFYRGEYRYDTMHSERVVEAEVRAAIRENGIADVEKVSAVILETDGGFSVIPELGDTNSALKDVEPFRSESNAHQEQTPR
ncbi:DUF421 domain-containing protein [Phytohalomonas tamaricis]|uniref:DUF421 domain-containing protein n=1 Tax=Phytohalomonas tamaricis TaxID=2081032 RepID=UPI000D0B42E6|nr:YetF domain-containing protein [Phytohalomonas tamaricis]